MARMALMRMRACVDPWDMDDAIYTLQAEVLRTMAHPRRLEVIHNLNGGPCEVGQLAREMGITQPNLSQHLAVMRAAGVVEAERTGREVRYRLADPDILAACGLMRDVLRRRANRLASVTQAITSTR